jgi:intein-encoded DNA endonuclease-like protein
MIVSFPWSGDHLASADISYLAGSFRDGCLSTQGQIKIKQKSRGYLVNKIIPILNREFDLDLTSRAVFSQLDENKRFYIAFKNVKVWNQIRKLFKIPHDSRLWKIPPFVKRLDRNLLRFYIQGFFDAEGGCPRNPMKSKLYISFTQRNRESIEFLRKRLCSEWRIESDRLRVSDHISHCWRFTITSRDSIRRFITDIGTEHPSKKKRFHIMLNLLDSILSSIA